ncbi:Tannase [Orbilia brochopaga]|nr:Tannase [Drechslerella brochopaga]
MRLLFSNVVLSLASIALPLASGHSIDPPSHAGPEFKRRCADLKRTFKPDHTRILVAEFLPKGTNWTVAPFGAPDCGFYGNGAIFQVDVCRLRLDIKTSSTSNVLAEVILPYDWENKGRRVITTGNGGLNGCIAVNDLTYASALGFVTVGTNNGHEGSSGAAFLHHPEVLKDFVYRSIVVGTELGKEAAKAFYGKKLGKIYYSGCSTGGRQGLKAAQEFPELFDGILSGAAASDFLDLEAWSGEVYRRLANPAAPSFLNVDQWQAVQDLVFKQCDTIDGVLDKIIEDPMKCRPRPEDLLCDREAGQTWESNKCLTKVQIDALNQLYLPTYSARGEFLYPRFQPGGEVQLGGAQTLFGPNILVDWFRYVTLNDTTWDFNSSWSLEAYEVMKAQDSFGISTFNPDLSKLRKTKHKLITYHGLEDGFITSENSYLYYNNVSTTMGLPSDKLDEFYRFFPISGLGHCGGGAGAWYLGAAGQAGTAFPQGFPISQGGGILSDLVKWVEDGKAPERVRGTSIGRAGEQIVRDHCKYPLKNTYKGGNLDPNLPTSWKCA